jgi:hypothetical protein
MSSLFNFMNCSNELGWRNDQNRSCRSLDLNEIYIFLVDYFFIWNHLWFQNCVWSSYILRFKFSNCSNKLGWRNDPNQSFRSRWDLQLCSWQLLYWKSFTMPKFCLKLSHFEVQFFQTTSDGKTTRNKDVLSTRGRGKEINADMWAWLALVVHVTKTTHKNSRMVKYEWYQ